MTENNIELKLEDIKLNDSNDMKCVINPNYEEIKASIRKARKLFSRLNVTRRPNDKLFMIESCGNTRLNILNELYLETADESFNTVYCQFSPWESETSLLIKHLIENEQRGKIALIDRAYAVQRLKRELEKEEGEEISDKKLIAVLSEKGYEISFSKLNRFNDAIKLDKKN